MSNKTALIPLNCLVSKCIREYCNHFNKNKITIHSKRDQFESEDKVKSFLNINLRQAIIDYLIRERVSSSSKLIIDLINGGLFSFDLWQMSEINNFKAYEVITILETLSNNCNNLYELVLGGSEWIYNSIIIKGPLKKFFDNMLNKLLSLKMQQIATHEDLLAIFESCPRLTRLEICQPSITDRDINQIEEKLKCCQVIKHLRHLLLPSSLKSHALLKLLTIFTNVETLKCAPFEQLLQLIDSMKTSGNEDDSQMASKAALTLSSLRSLTITHPMSYDTIDSMVKMCPKLERISIEVQEGMQLFSMTNLLYLKHIELRNSPTMPASYSQQVLPILQTKGNSLESLSLEQFDVIDLTSCAKLCPNLLRFSAQWFTILGFNGSNLSSNKRESVKNPFSKLTHLRLRPRSQRNIPSDACAFALIHAKHITHIELYCCYELSDNDVQLLQSKNPMTHLISLILRHGHNVTKDALNLLVSRAHSLSFIDCGTPPLKKGDQINDDLPPDPQVI